MKIPSWLQQYLKSGGSCKLFLHGATDLSSNGNNATAVGSPIGVRLLDDIKGYSITNSAGGTPATQYLYLPNSASLSPGTGNFTINLWFNTTDSRTTPRFLVCKYNSSNTNATYSVIMNLSQCLQCSFRDINGNAILVIGTTAINDGKNHMVTSVRNGTTLSLYLDSKLVGTNTNVSISDVNTNSSGSYTFLGAYGTSTSVGNLDNAYSGKLYTPCMENRALTQTEIQELYYSNPLSIL